jgi:DMSO reductase anchor subunit
VLVVGILALAASLGLSIASLVGWQNGLDGAQFLLVVCLFGVFASVEFLRRRSVKLLMVALTLGVMVDVVAMIAIPVYNAVTDVEVVDASRPDGEEEKDIRPVNDLLDENRVMWGISLLVVYAATAVYLNSPAVRRCFERR